MPIRGNNGHIVKSSDFELTQRSLLRRIGTMFRWLEKERIYDPLMEQDEQWWCEPEGMVV